MFLSGELVAELESEVTKSRNTLEPRIMAYRPNVAELFVDNPTAGRANVGLLFAYLFLGWNIHFIHKSQVSLLFLQVLVTYRGDKVEGIPAQIIIRKAQRVSKVEKREVEDEEPKRVSKFERREVESKPKIELVALPDRQPLLQTCQVTVLVFFGY